MYIIKTGRIYATLLPADIRDGKIQTDLSFDQSGWFLVRVIAKNPYTFRFASTAPYYVEIGQEKKRISRSSAQYLLDWARLRASRIELSDPEQRKQVFSAIDKGLAYWENMVGKANAE